MLMIADRLYTAEQVRRLDACAIGEHGMPGFTLMQRAGVAVFEAARERFTSARRWLVLCGAGNNGGDGYIVARLAREAGLKVTLCALQDPAKLDGDAARAARAWFDAGGQVRQWPLRGKVRADLVIDALLGTGLDRDVEGRYRDAVARVGVLGCPVVAVDIPSGIHADSGRVMGCAVRADVTVSFIGQKRGLFTGDGPDHRGELIFDELGTPAEIHEAVGPAGRRLRESVISELLPGRPLNSHKGHYGHVLVAGGDQGMSGAARLAGEAALRSGAGLVTVATHAAHAALLNLSRPELMVAAVAERGEIEARERASVLALGPGLGTRAWGRAVFESLIHTDLPAVIDADGLNLLAEKPQQRGDWVLTPHPAEAARLAGCTTAEIQADRVGHALGMAQKFNAVVVLKGCGSVMAEPAGAYAICPLGNPGMATAGCGDVLTGVIAGLLGQGLSPWHAALVGVVAHAAAGDRVAERQGRVGLLASDITSCLPLVLNR
jgi:NAD(P)H-hydrate epimerase